MLKPMLGHANPNKHILPTDYPTNLILMLQQSQGTLDHDVLQDGSGRNINGAAFCSNDNDCALESDASAEIDSSGDGQMVEFNDLRDTANALLEV